MVGQTAADRLKTKGEQQAGVQSANLTRRFTGDGTATLSKGLQATYEDYRKIRKHPTVALARALSIAPIIGADWSYEADKDVDDERTRLIQAQMQPLRPRLLQVCMEHRVDYGWAPWEKVFDVRAWEGRSRVWLKNAKPLLVDLTDVLLDPDTGAFAGFEQPATASKPDKVTLETPYSFLCNFGVEGDNLYGEPLLENIRPTFNDWTEANKGAQRYDRKVAGSHWVVYFPIGFTPLDDVSTANDVIAAQILDALEASGAVAVPQTIVKYVDDLQKLSTGAWKIEILSSVGQQYAFDSRLGYLDTQMVRGLLVPERSILEGTFGTKAEAGVHAGLALTQRELEHEHVTRLANWHIVDQLLAANYGEDARGSVRIVPSPLVDTKRAFFEAVYSSVLANPVGFMDAFNAIDLDSLTDAVGLLRVDSEAESPDGIDMQNQMVSMLRELYATANRGASDATPSG